MQALCQPTSAVRSQGGSVGGPYPQECHEPQFGAHAPCWRASRRGDSRVESRPALHAFRPCSAPPPSPTLPASKPTSLPPTALRWPTCRCARSSSRAARRRLRDAARRSSVPWPSRACCGGKGRTPRRSRRRSSRTPSRAASWTWRASRPRSARTSPRSSRVSRAPAGWRRSVPPGPTPSRSARCSSPSPRTSAWCSSSSPSA